MLASLLGAGCGGERGTSAPDLAAVAGARGDLGCAAPVALPGCTWLSYVDMGTVNGNIAYWNADGGADPCAPCGFEATPGAWCGQCQVIANGCGVAYFCSTLDCTAACDFSGRRPAGLQRDEARASEPGARFARMAELEAASVPAFAQLARELAAHGAPESLIAAARRALADEERHARMMTELARAAGARAVTPDVASTPLRPLVAIAVENVVEGCVRETAGAVAAAVEARRFAAPSLRRIFAAIAVDERRHADLAWAVDAWAAPRLTPAERRLVAAARAGALRSLFA